MHLLSCSSCPWSCSYYCSSLLLQGKQKTKAVVSSPGGPAFIKGPGLFSLPPLPPPQRPQALQAVLGQPRQGVFQTALQQHHQQQLPVPQQIQMPQAEQIQIAQPQQIQMPASFFRPVPGTVSAPNVTSQAARAEAGEIGAADPGAKHGADDQPALCVTVHKLTEENIINLSSFMYKYKCVALNKLHQF